MLKQNKIKKKKLSPHRPLVLPSKVIKRPWPVLVVIFLILAGAMVGMMLYSTKAEISGPKSLRSGNWSDPTLWSNGRIPDSNEQAIIASDHVVVYDLSDTKISGMRIESGAVLQFSANISATLNSSQNIVVEGVLAMNPANSSHQHVLRFVDVDESIFVGGGMEPIASDVGLWVMDAGRLDATGSNRLGWGRSTGSIAAGSTNFVLDTDPVGWKVGDEISIAPTEHGHVQEFDVRTIHAISGRTISLNVGVQHAHPAVEVTDGKIMTAEIMNLTRNVRIEGMPPAYRYPRAEQINESGRSHIFIRNTSPVVHTIRHVAIRYMGPRQYDPTIQSSRFLLGRYGLHIHMGEENNRGTVVEGTVIRDTDAQSYVPHTSHGITFRDTVSYNTSETAYWWDVKSNEQAFLNNDSTNDIIYDRTIAALIDVDFRGDTRLAGYTFAPGTGNVMQNTVAVGVRGRVQASGYLWPEGGNGPSNVWKFDANNVSHNNQINGSFSWQNDSEPHVIKNFIAYHNGQNGIDHGAYTNNFVYTDSVLYRNNTKHQLGGEVTVHSRTAKSTGDPQSVNNVTIDTLSNYALDIPRHRIAAVSGLPTIFANWNVIRYAKAAVMVNETTESSINRGEFEFVCWTLPGGRELDPQDFEIIAMAPESTFRIQRRNGSAYQLFADGTSQVIPKFSECSDTTNVPKPGDTNSDGAINGIDLSKVLTNYGKIGMVRQDGDLDGNGMVNAIDLSQVLSNYGR